MEPVDLNSAAAVATKRRPGRPTRCTPDRLARMLLLIRTQGLSDSAAARLVGLSRPTIGRWKRRQPATRQQLAEARSRYQDERAAAFDAAADHRPLPRGWRGAARELERAFRGEYSRYALRKHANRAEKLQNSRSSTYEHCENHVNPSHLLQNSSPAEPTEQIEEASYLRALLASLPTVTHSIFQHNAPEEV